MLIDLLQEHMLPGPLPRPDLTLPDDQVPHADLAAWLQFDQLWALIADLERQPEPTPPIARIRLQRIFHHQDRLLRTKAQHDCLTTVTRYTLTLIDHAEDTRHSPPEPERNRDRSERSEQLHGTRATWAGQGTPPPTPEAERIARHVNEIRQRIRSRHDNPTDDKT